MSLPPVIHFTTKGDHFRQGGTGARPQVIDPSKYWGPPLWAELHRRPWAFGGDAAAEFLWLAAFARRIPCHLCRQHWAEILATQPPDLSSCDAYFAWTVGMHNRVNASLGKPQFPVEQAARRYKPAGSPGA